MTTPSAGLDYLLESFQKPHLEDSQLLMDPQGTRNVLVAPGNIKEPSAIQTKATSDSTIKGHRGNAMFLAVTFPSG